MAGYHAKKRLGQNFLKSPEVIQRIIDEVDHSAGKPVIEIGPGRGALTHPLAESGVDLLAVEFDRDLVGYLEKLVRKFDNATILHADFLTFEPDAERYPKFTLLGNLPYNITSPVMDWCDRYHERIETAVFMVQEELALRLSGSPGSKNWSPLSVMTQMLFDVDFRFRVSAKAFRPPPKVTSAVVKLTPRETVIDTAADAVRQVVKASFKQRRKLLVNNLVPETIPTVEQAREILDNLGLDRSCRAEQVTIEQFLALTSHLRSHNLV